ncbi:MAG: ComEC/Rec2 family competence protein [Rhizobiaceae bacterium]
MSADAGEIVGERRQFDGRRGAAGDQHAPGTGSPDPQQSSRRWLRLLRARCVRALEEEWDRGTGFVFLPVMMGGGALIYFTLPYEPATLPIVLAAIVLLVLLALLRAAVLLRAALAAALLLLAGIGAGKVESWRAGTQMNGSEVATRVTGRVVRIEHQASGRIRLTLDLLATERPTLRHAPARIRLSARAVPEETRPGSVVSGVARLMPLSGPVRPGSYDFSFHAWFDGLGAVGFFYRNPELAEPPPGWEATAWQQMALWIEDVRLSLAQRVRAQIGGAEGEIAATLIAGIRAGIPDETAEALRRTGMAHILAISGLHMALVAGTVLLGFRIAFGLFPDFSSRHPVKKYAALAALMACAFYLSISGAAVAAQRSFIMLAVMLTALVFDRAALTMRNLAIAALIIIAISPHEVTGPSFHMSFAATAALIGAYAMWSEHRARRYQQGLVPPADLSLAARIRRYVLYFLGGLAMTSIIAGLATALYGAYHFYRVPPLALIANLAAMPVVTALVMPFAVLSVLAMPFGLDGPFLWVMGSGLAYVNGVAAWVSELSPFDAVGILPVAGVLALSLALVLATLTTTVLRASALVPALLGVWMLADRTLPEVLVSEDGRLVAVRTAAQTLAVNRDRPNAFTIQDWTRALGLEDFATPATARREGFSGFECEDELCMATTVSGRLIAHVPDEERAAALCAQAALVVIDDATAQSPCGAQTAVLTKRDLARRGSAAVTFAGEGARIEQAIAEPFRPWHAHRRFSRAARGLAPWRPAPWRPE